MSKDSSSSKTCLREDGEGSTVANMPTIELPSGIKPKDTSPPKKTNSYIETNKKTLAGLRLQLGVKNNG